MLRKKEKIEVTVRAEALINQLEKSLEDQGDKVDAKQKETLEKQIQELKDLVKEEKIEELKTKLDQIEQAAQAFAQAAAQQANTSDTSSDDQPIEAEVKEN